MHQNDKHVGNCDGSTVWFYVLHSIYKIFIVSNENKEIAHNS